MSVIYSIGRGTARERMREREMASQVKIGDWFIELDTSSLGIIFFFLSASSEWKSIGELEA